MSAYTYKNIEFKGTSVDVKETDTYSNTSENMKEVRKEGLWRNNCHTPINKASEFPLRGVNIEDIASENGIEMKTFSNSSEILDVTGNYYYYSILRKLVPCLSVVCNNKKYL